MKIQITANELASAAALHLKNIGMSGVANVVIHGLPDLLDVEFEIHKPVRGKRKEKDEDTATTPKAKGSNKARAGGSPFDEE